MEINIYGIISSLKCQNENSLSQNSPAMETGRQAVWTWEPVTSRRPVSFRREVTSGFVLKTIVFIAFCSAPALRRTRWYVWWL